MDTNLVCLNEQEPVATRFDIEGSWQKRFIAYLDASQKTIQTYQRALRQFFRYLYSKGIKYPERRDILAYRDELKTNLRPSTVQSYIIVVKLFFRWTAQERLYPDIAEHIKGAKLTKEHKKDYLTSNQAKGVLEKQKDNVRNYALLAIMLTGGLRTVEICRAKVGDIRTLGNDTVLYVQGKGRDEATEYIKLTSEVENALRRYLNSRGRLQANDALFVSTSNNSLGKPLTTRSISQIIKKSLLEAGFDSSRLTAHSLRHTAVTLALLNGVKLEEVQQFARHKNISTTMIYAHHLDRTKNQCEDTLSNALFSSE